MHRIWEIKEGYGHRMGSRDLDEAYEQGCRDGYEKALMELGERRGSYGSREDYWGDRRRDSRGRYL